MKFIELNRSSRADVALQACIERSVCILAMLIIHLAWTSPAKAQISAANWPTPQEGDYVPKDFHFKDGSSLPELRLLDPARHRRRGHPVSRPSVCRCPL